MARPNVLMFGDAHWIESRALEQQARQNAWLATLRQPVVIEIGAGKTIGSVRNFSQFAGAAYGARLIRINPADAHVADRRDVGLAVGAMAALDAIARAGWA